MARKNRQPALKPRENAGQPFSLRQFEAEVAAEIGVDLRPNPVVKNDEVEIVEKND